MTDPERLQHALDLAYRFLGHRDRTVAEVRERLAAEGIEEAVVEEAVEELRHLGYLDDARYARTFAEDRRNLDGWGAERIERRLLALGVDREHVAAAVGGRDGAEELEAALGLLRHRFRGGGLEGERERERALGMLVRKGYELELAYDAVRAFERAAA